MRPGQEGAEEVAGALEELHGLLAAAAAAAVERGELAPHTDPDALAAFLVVAIQGFRLTGTARPDARGLHAAVEGILTGLRPVRGVTHSSGPGRPDGRVARA